ncbi:hypothetical protein JG688_00017412 [Phytophthora aleatoria]|uniref:Uncharacterized protein n=1 Tax=Phytophthora aleatoria TaxID=2496075 RepID=A0A8J5M1C5_9STRA|nr:hypothetical protein JG688_00017412 [Phytophthora aleatoria]
MPIQGLHRKCCFPATRLWRYFSTSCRWRYGNILLSARRSTGETCRRRVPTNKRHKKRCRANPTMKKKNTASHLPRITRRGANQAP